MSDPVVLVAVDATDAGPRAARAAVRLFGDRAEYVVAHVAEPVPLVPPVATPPGVLGGTGVAPPVYPGVDDDVSRAEAVESAADVARSARLDAGLPDTVAAVGLVGEPVGALLDEARHRSAGVIVVGEHDRGWLTELLTSSVADQIQEDAHIPVLVVPAPR
jgi:nucleotide-binding universal stress UspA family protein